MHLKTFLKTALQKLDRLSLHPVLYPFVMSNAEKKLFDQAIKDSRHYLEFGLGGSTIRAIQKSKAMVYSVESSADWVECVRKYLFVRLSERRRLRIFQPSIGPVGDWGYPTSNEFRNLFERYSSEVFQAIDSRLIDLALIDGRFRVACTLQLIMACRDNRNIRVLIHDFWNRPQYHAVLKYLDTVGRADTLGLFSIKKEIDMGLVRQDYESYKFTPE
jgi:hypothetical protein